MIKNEKNKIKTISYRLQFIDSARFMASSLSNHVNNLAEGMDKIKCKYGLSDKKKMKLAELNTKIANAFLNTRTLNMI